MRLTSRLLIAALFLQFFVGGVSAEAATAPLRINSVTVNGIVATVKWNPVKLTSKDFFEVEFTKTATAKANKVIKTKSNAIVAKLDPFTQYTVRIKRTLAPNVWSPIRTFSISSDPVSGLAATNTTYNSSEISWLPVPGATSYEIILNKTPLISVITTKYTLTNLKVGSSNSVEIRAKSAAIPGGLSTLITVTTLNDAPKNLIANSVTTTGFVLTWDLIPNATSYNLYRDGAVLANAKTNTYSAVNLVPGTSNNYTVSAVFSTGESAQSSSVSVATLLAVPQKPRLVATSTLTADISWQIDPNAVSYTLNLFDSTGTLLVNTVTVEKSLAAYQFTSLTPNTTYSVGILNNYAKNSTKTSDLTVFTTGTPTITGFSATTVTSTTVTVGWNAMPGAASYEVIRDSAVLVAGMSTTTLSYSFTGLAPGQTYKLGVRATYVSGSKLTVVTNASEATVVTLTDISGKPTNTAIPVVTLPYANTPIVGATLSSTSGNWSAVPAVSSIAYKWQKSNDAGTNWVDIPSATAATYLVSATDIGFILRSSVTVANTNGSTTSNSAATGVTAPIYNIAAPVVRGLLVVGQVLDASDGVWSSPYTINLSYVWRRDSGGSVSAISGAISPSYTLTETDIGTSISVQVTATTLLGSLSVNSGQRGLVTIVGNTVLPVITGSLRVGGTLSVSTGTWIGTPASNTYQWQSSVNGTDWDSISGATNATFVVQAAQAGLYLRAQVFGNKTSAASVAYRITAATLSTAIIPALNIQNTAAPVVSGAWTQGTTISTTAGSWSATGTFTYQWQSSSDNSTWADISGATSSTYALTSNEASKFVRVQVVNTNASGAGIAFSAARSKVGAPFNTALPAITGTLKIGSTQTVSTGTWSNTPTSYGYQWQKSSDGISWINLSGETANTYVPTFDVANLQVRVNVSGVNAVDTATVSSAVISGFVPPQASAVPAITGTGTVGQTLTSSSGTWPNTSSGYLYQWQRSSDGGVTWTSISGATSPTYVLVAADAGYVIRSQVSLTANAGSSSAYSLATAAIAPAP
jgi:hypothetical protein